jgi:hypothetical protein
VPAGIVEQLYEPAQAPGASSGMVQVAIYLSKNLVQVGRSCRNDPAFFVLVFRETGQFAMMRRIVVAKHAATIGALVVDLISKLAVQTISTGPSNEIHAIT